MTHIKHLNLKVRNNSAVFSFEKKREEKRRRNLKKEIQRNKGKQMENYSNVNGEEIEMIK